MSYLSWIKTIKNKFFLKFSSSLLNKVNNFANESQLIYNFLSLEQTLNTQLREVRSTADDPKAALEGQCQLISPNYGSNVYTKEDAAVKIIFFLMFFWSKKKYIKYI